MANDLPPEAKRVVTYAERVSATLALGGTVCTAAILGRAFGHDTIKVQSFDIPLGYIAAVIGIGTVAHVFWSFFILKDLVKFQKLLQIKEGEIPPSESESRVSTQTLFDEIRTHKGLFLLGLVPRTFRDGSSIAKMSLSDPTTWLSYGIALLTIIAILPWRVDHGLHWASPEMIIAYTGIALILVVINWWAGGL
jgi:hypothetical protein